MLTSRPRVAVVGPGAVGCFFGGHLAAAGRREVVFCGRRRLARIRVSSDAAPLDLAAPAMVLAPQRVGRVDWVLLATKCHQTAGAAPWLRRLCDARTRVLVLQNGVDHRERVAPWVGGATVVPAIVFCGVEARAPGDIVHRTHGYAAVQDDVAGRAAAALFEGAAAAIRPTGDLAAVAWDKLCSNAANGAITALTRRRNEVLREPAIQDLCRAVVAEVAAVGRAAGVTLPDDIADRVVERMAGWDPAGGSSMLYDHLAGRPIEHEARNGVVVRLADRYGVEVPVCRTLAALLAAASVSV